MKSKWVAGSGFCLCLVLMLCVSLSAAALEGHGFRVEGRKLIIAEGVVRIGLPLYADDAQSAPAIASEKLAEAQQIPAFDGNLLRANEIVFPSSLRALGSEAFSFFQLASVHLPEGLVRLDADAFYGCTIGTLHLPTTLLNPDKPSGDTWLTAIEVPDQHPTLKSVDGVLFSKDGTELICYPRQRPGAHYDVPAGVKTIRAHAFSENHALTSVSLPLGLQSIKRGAFWSCGRLNGIALPLTLRELQAYGFANCVSLERVSMGHGVSLGEGVFRNCPLLAEAGRFQGDNGGTQATRSPDADSVLGDHSASWDASEGLLVAPDGEASIPLYDRDWQNDSIELVGHAQPGAIVRIGLRIEDSCYVSYHRWQPPSSAAPERRTFSEQSGFVKREHVLRLPKIREFDIVSLEPRHDKVPIFSAPYINASEAPSLPFSSLHTQDIEPAEQFSGWISFAYPVLLEEDGEIYGYDEHGWASLRDFHYLRKRTGDQRVYAILAPKGVTSPLLEAPSASSGVLMQAYAGNHVEVLAQQGDYWKVRLGPYQGYMDAEALIIVPQQAQEGP